MDLSGKGDLGVYVRRIWVWWGELPKGVEGGVIGGSDGVFSE